MGRVRQAYAKARASACVRVGELAETVPSTPACNNAHARAHACARTRTRPSATAWPLPPLHGVHAHTHAHNAHTLTCTRTTHIHKQVMRTGGSPDDLAEPTRALAANNTFVDGGRVDGLPAHKKSVAGAAKKLEAMLADASKVRNHATLWGHTPVGARRVHRCIMHS